VRKQWAGAAPVIADRRMPIRLLAGGQTMGVLVLTGDRLDVLRAETIAAIGFMLAAMLQAITADRQRRFITHTTSTVRRLFEEGTVATSVEEAGELLARVTAEAFHTERAGLCLVDDGRIGHVVGVGLPADRLAALAAMSGRVADESPAWRAAAAARNPMLIADTAGLATHPDGLVRTLGLRSCVALPLISADTVAGLVVCGDPDATREWDGRDRALAEQLAAEGALIVESARLRQAERQHMAELTRQAFHDALTGLPNRTHLLERAEQALRSAATRGERVGLLMIDLDGFKAVNDTAGHHTGDALLRAVAKRVLGVVRGDDLVSRLGGDEFAVLLTGDPDEYHGRAVAARIRERLRAPFRIENRKINIDGSIGLALFPEHGADVDALIRGADAAMYQAKRDGGGIRVAP
jgi:diguanylate cyclase (GGDEF)-like protein